MLMTGMARTDEFLESVTKTIKDALKYRKLKEEGM